MKKTIITVAILSLMLSSCGISTQDAVQAAKQHILDSLAKEKEKQKVDSLIKANAELQTKNANTVQRRMIDSIKAEMIADSLATFKLR